MMFCMIFVTQQLFSHAFLQQAAQLFYEQKYDKALDLYKKIEPKDATVWYNIGLTYLHLEDNLQADIAFARAEKYGTWQIWKKIDEINIYLALEKNPDFVAKWSDQLAIFCKRCILSISMIISQLFLLIILMVLFIMYWYKKWNTYKNYFVASFFGFFFFCMILYKEQMLMLQRGIVVQDIADVYAGPDSSFYKKDKVEQGDMLTWSKDSVHGYYQVFYDNKCGWVHKKNIEIL